MWRQKALGIRVSGSLQLAFSSARGIVVVLIYKNNKRERFPLSKCTYMDTPRKNTLQVMRFVNPFPKFTPEDRPWQEQIWRAVVCEGKLLWWLALLHANIGTTAPRTGKNMFSSFKSHNSWYLLWESGLTNTAFSAKSCVPHSARRDHVDLVEKPIYSHN